jgi:hypothetical protein
MQVRSSHARIGGALARTTLEEVVIGIKGFVRRCGASALARNRARTNPDVVAHGAGIRSGHDLAH